MRYTPEVAVFCVGILERTVLMVCDKCDTFPMISFCELALIEKGNGTYLLITIIYFQFPKLLCLSIGSERLE